LPAARLGAKSDFGYREQYRHVHPFFHKQFPSAKIYGFELHPETFRILQANVGSIPSVEVNYALGATDAKIPAAFNGVDFSGLVAKPESVKPPGAAIIVECDVSTPERS
jgi:hypothetical protein